MNDLDMNAGRSGRGQGSGYGSGPGSGGGSGPDDAWEGDTVDLRELAKLLEDDPSPGSPPPGGRGGGRAPAAAHPASAGGAWALVTLLVLLAGMWAVSPQRTLPSPVPANAPDSAFSSGRAMGRLVELARAPRPVGSPEHTRVRQLVVERLEDLGLEPEIHTSLSLRRSGPDVRATTIRNVLARIPGTASTGAVVLTAHYDAVPLSAGAGDDGTGVVTVLEIARALLHGGPLRNDVLVLLTDGEELGLLGSRAFVEEHPAMDDVAVVLSVEMRGGGGPVHMFETGAENGWIVRAMQTADPRPLGSSLSVELYRRLPNDTDFTPFREAGIQGLNFAAIGRASVYHQPTDVPANIEEETIQHHGVRVLALARALGRSDLSSVHAPDVVYETLPFFGVVAYPAGRALPYSLGILLLWAGVAFLAGRRGRWRGLAVGVALTVASGGLAWLLGRVLLAWLPRFHPEFQSMTPAFHGERWYFLGVAAGAAAVTLALLGLARRRFDAAPLAAGAVLLPVLGAVALAAVAPLAAAPLQGTGLAAVLATAVVALAERGGATGATAWWPRLLVLLPTLAALAFVAPLFEGVSVAMSFRLAPLLGVVAVVGAVCVLPALDQLGAPNRWWAPAASALLAALLVGGGVLAAGPSADRPLHSTLLWALDREEGRAFWATREDPGQAWAENAVGPFTDQRSLQAFLIPAEYRTAPAVAYPVPPPVVRSEGGGGPVYRLNVVSEAGAEIVSVALADGADAGIVAVTGAAVPAGEPGTAGARRPATRVVHQGVPEGGALAVDVQAPAGAEALRLIVVEHHLRPADHIGTAAFERPAHLVPSPPGRSDRALIRTPLLVPLEPGG